MTVIPRGIPTEEEVILHVFSLCHLDNQIATFGPRECVYLCLQTTYCLLNF